MRIQKSVVPLMNDTKQSVARLARLNQSGVYLTRANWSPSCWLSETSGYTRGTGEDTSGQWCHLLSAWNTLIHYTSFSWLLYNQHYIIQTICDFVKYTFEVPSLINTHSALWNQDRQKGTGTHLSRHPRRIKTFDHSAKGFLSRKKIPLLRWIQHDVLVI